MSAGGHSETCKEQRWEGYGGARPTCARAGGGGEG